MFKEEPEEFSSGFSFQSIKDISGGGAFCLH